MAGYLTSWYTSHRRVEALLTSYMYISLSDIFIIYLSNFTKEAQLSFHNWTSVTFILPYLPEYKSHWNISRTPQNRPSKSKIKLMYFYDVFCLFLLHSVTLIIVFANLNSNVLCIIIML